MQSLQAGSALSVKLANPKEIIINLNIMRRNSTYLLLAMMAALPILRARSQGACVPETWSVERCIQYAVNHNHDVRLQQFSLRDSHTERLRSMGSFLPTVEAGSSVQYNFGRAIDPETNTYTNVSTFYNGYNLTASIPVFDGLQRWNGLQTAKANVLQGRHSVQAQKDEVAQRVLRQYTDVLYCRGALSLACSKREESLSLLRRACVMAEVGTCSEADTAQMRANFAADDYEVTRQQNLLSTAVLALKQLMNFPVEEPLVTDSVIPVEPIVPTEAVADIAIAAMQTNPSVKVAEMALRSARYGLRSARGAFFPTVSLGAGVSSTYYRQVGRGGYEGAGFRSQLRNNAGEYVFASLSLPLFSRLDRVCNLRRRRNDVVRAGENLDARRRDLHRLVEEAVAEHRACLVEVEKARCRVEADSLAARLVIRRFEEGLASPTDVQTATVTLLRSRAALLQCRLGYVYVNRMMNYYKGIPLWTE